MELFKELGISLDKSEMISIVGGGGKTTSMFRLGRELASHGKKILITTTTAIMKPKESSYNQLALIDEKQVNYDSFDIKDSTITVMGSKLIKDNKKLKGIDKEVIDVIFKKGIFDYIIVEADGAKRKAIKAPNLHEPVIPNSTTIVIGLIGLDVVYKKLYEENVHRSDIFARITNSKIGDQIDEKVIYALLVSKDGIFKSTPIEAKKFVILNKAETNERIKVANRVVQMIKKNNINIEKIIVGSMKGD